jgi:hypothetical protein
MNVATSAGGGSATAAPKADNADGGKGAKRGGGGKAKAKSKKGETLSGLFKKQLNVLMVSLRATHPHFVRYNRTPWYAAPRRAAPRRAAAFHFHNAHLP